MPNLSFEGVFPKVAPIKILKKIKYSIVAFRMLPLLFFTLLSIYKATVSMN